MFEWLSSHTFNRSCKQLLIEDLTLGEESRSLMSSRDWSSFYVATTEIKHSHILRNMHALFWLRHRLFSNFPAWSANDSIYIHVVETPKDKINIYYDDFTKWKHFLHYWPFVRGNNRSPVDSPHKGQWRGALMLSLICPWTNGGVNNRGAGDLRRHRGHYEVTVK